MSLQSSQLLLASLEEARQLFLHRPPCPSFTSDCLSQICGFQSWTKERQFCLLYSCTSLPSSTFPASGLQVNGKLFKELMQQSSSQAKGSHQLPAAVAPWSSALPGCMSTGTRGSEELQPAQLRPSKSSAEINPRCLCLLITSAVAQEGLQKPRKTSWVTPV